MKIRAPAKLNLFLRVLGKRPDGYHDLYTLMCPIDLYDLIELKFGGEGIRVSCDAPGVPSDETNLAWRAASLFFRELGEEGRVEISIEKHIPVAAGLGGGSSDAAAVLSGLNRRHGRPFSTRDLTAMGLSLGADVPFFILGRPAIATGVGEKLQYFDELEPAYVVLISPGFSVSTADVYKNLNLGLTNHEKPPIDAPLIGKGFHARDHLCNDLETVTAARHSSIEEAKRALLMHGAEGALMSGSGPAVFGLFSDPDRAKRAERSLSQYRGEWKPFLAKLIV